MLVGWAADIPWLRDPVGAFVVMVPNTALMLVLAGLSLGLSVSARASRLGRWIGKALAVACAAFAAATLAQDLLGRNLGIDTLLYDAHPARPATPSSLALLLASVAILVIDVRPRRGPAPSELLAAGMVGIGSLTLGGFLYGAIQFYVSSRHPLAVGMAIHTSIALLVLAIGILTARPDTGVMGTFTSALVGGQAVRRTLLIALSIPVLGYLAVRLQVAGAYVPPGAAVVTSFVGMMTAVVIALAVGESLNRADRLRRRTEEESREWKRFFDRATFGAAFGTVDGRLGLVNETFARIHGSTVEELTGRAIADVFLTSRRAEAAEKMRVAHERGHCRWESEHVRKDGSVFPVVIDASAVRDEHGTLLYRAAYVQDITEEKKAEAELARATALLDGLVRASPLAIIAVDLEGNVDLWNPAAERIFGWTADEAIGKPLAVIPAEEADAFAKVRERVLVRQEVMPSLEHKRKRRDGTLFDACSSAAPLVCNGKLAGMMAVVEDITARKRSLEALRESEERFRLALDEAPIGMALVGLDGRFLRVNGVLCEIVGYTREELVGLTFQAITHPNDVDADVALARKLARGEIPRYQLGKRYIRKDGAIVDAMLSASIVRAGDGAPLYYIAQIEDVTDRKRAEDALRRSEAQFRELIEHAPDPIFIADLDGRFTDVNTAACRMLRYMRGELVGKTIVDIIPPEDVPRLAEAREFLLVPGRVQVAEWTQKTKDGALVPVEVSSKIHADGRWVAFVRDVSERKRNQEALQRSEATLARAQRVARLGSWDWDLRTDEVTRSAELLHLFGLEPGDVSPQRWSMRDHIHPNDREAVERTVDEAAREGHAYSLEHRIVLADGSERVMLHQGEPVLMDGRTVRMVGTLLDITERKRAESEREETLQWLRAVLDQIPVGVLLLHGPGGERVETNRRMQIVLGKTIERAGQYVDRLLDPDGRSLRPEELPSMRALRGETLDGAEYLVRNAAGALVPVLKSAVPIIDANGNVQGAVVAMLDITAAKELERLRTEWGSVVAHDLRQPINTIALSLQMLARAGDDAKARGRLVGTMQAAARRLDRMVGDLMDLSRLEAHRLELLRQPTDVPATVQASVERIAQSAPPDRRFDVIIHGDIPPASADADRIAQIVENLLSNAVKYGAPGTPIRIEEAGEHGELSVAVTNEGEGIPPEQMPQLFRRFQRTQGAKTGRIKGTGLGLYITKELVEAHGGHITVESTPGATTTFRFTLPLA